MMVLQLYSSHADQVLRGLFSENSFPLYRLMGYQMGWLDEAGLELPSPVAQTRLHASLALAACEAVGGSIDQAAPAGVAVEMLSQFVQVHSDIQDGLPERYNRSTLWWVWGPAQAINTGDGFHALARLQLMQLLEGAYAAAGNPRYGQHSRQGIVAHAGGIAPGYGLPGKGGYPAGSIP